MTLCNSCMRLCIIAESSHFYKSKKMASVKILQTHLFLCLIVTGKLATGTHSHGTGTTSQQCGELWEYYNDGNVDGLSLNLNTSLPYSGTAVAWHFNFYVAEDRHDLHSEFLVYRAASLHEYEVVEGSFTDIRVPRSELDKGEYICRRATITEPFDVREGDVLGVCLDSRRHTPLIFAKEENRTIFIGPAATHDCDSNIIAAINLAEWPTPQLNLELLLELEIVPHSTTTTTTITTTAQTELMDGTSVVMPVVSTIASTHTSMDQAAVTTMASLHTSTVRPSSRVSTAGGDSPATPATPLIVPTIVAGTNAYMGVTGSWVFLATAGGAGGEAFVGNIHSIKISAGVGGTAGVVLTVALFLICIVLFRKISSKSSKTQDTSESERRNNSLTNVNIDTSNQFNDTEDTLQPSTELITRRDHKPYTKPAATEEALYIQIQQQKVTNIPKYRIETTVALGQGHFGVVKKGIWHEDSGMMVVVAVKEGVAKEDKIKLLQEAAILSQFSHPNVLKLYGVVAEMGMVMLVMEIAPNGDLKNHLQTLQNSSTADVTALKSQLLAYSTGVARGMLYLTRKGFIHRDLAARNILITADQSCKIADFGMSRDLEENKYYVSKNNIIPVKWTAPEAIKYSKHSPASDVWSYGCLLYEIWTLGEDPYDDLNNLEVPAHIEAGYRPTPPSSCPTEMRDLMMHCWGKEAKDRPTFQDIMITITSEVPKLVSMIYCSAYNDEGEELFLGENLYYDIDETLRSHDDHIYDRTVHR